jgi:hypothetical protein
MLFFLIRQLGDANRNSHCPLESGTAFIQIYRPFDLGMGDGGSDQQCGRPTGDEAKTRQPNAQNNSDWMTAIYSRTHNDNE